MGAVEDGSANCWPQGEAICEKAERGEKFLSRSAEIKFGLVKSEIRNCLLSSRHITITITGFKFSLNHALQTRCVLEQ